MKTTGFSVGISDLIADEDTNVKINEIIENKKELTIKNIHHIDWEKKYLEKEFIEFIKLFKKFNQFNESVAKTGKWRKRGK